MINGGYYLKARKIQESAIARMPPHVREIWDWLLMKAMFTNGTHLQRGQVLATYDDIREGLHWFIGWRKMMYSKWDCEKAMKLLTKATMVTTQKTTKGLIITILNYSEYQDPKNYESHTESHKKATRKPQTTDTIDKNDKNDKNENTTYNIYGDQKNIKFTADEYSKLNSKYGEPLTEKAIQYLSKYKVEKGYTTKSDYLTIIRWVFDAVKERENKNANKGFSTYRNNKNDRQLDPDTAAEIDRIAESLRAK